MATDSIRPLTHTSLSSEQNAPPNPAQASAEPTSVEHEARTAEGTDAARGDDDLAWLSLSGEEVLDIDHEMLLLSLLSLELDEDAPCDHDAPLDHNAPGDGVPFDQDRLM